MMREKLRREREHYLRRWNLPTDLNPVDNIIQFILIVAYSITRVPSLLISLIKWTIFCYAIYAISYFGVHGVVYGTMHFVIDPVIDESIKLINDITKGLQDAINSVKSVGVGFVNTVRSGWDSAVGTRHKHAITSKKVILFTIDKNKLGKDYNALVNLKKLCNGYRHQPFAEFHIVMQALTSRNLCLALREVSPSPLLLYLGTLLYGADFAVPEGRNCHIDRLTGYCFAWMFPYLFLTLLQVITVVKLVFFFEPEAAFLLSHFVAYIFTLEYILTHGSANAAHVLDYHVSQMTEPSGEGHTELRQALLARTVTG